MTYNIIANPLQACCDHKCTHLVTICCVLIRLRPTVTLADCNRMHVSVSASISSPLTPVYYQGQPVECSWTIDGGTYRVRQKKVDS